MAKIFKLEHRVVIFTKTFTFYGDRNNLPDLLGDKRKLNVIVATVLLLVEKKDKSYF